VKRRPTIPLLVLIVACVLPSPASGGASPLGSLKAESGRAAGLLAAGATDDEVRAVQRGVLEGLDALIAALEAQDAAAAAAAARAGQMPTPRPGSATGAPRKPAEESVAGGRRWATGRLGEEPAGGEAWLPGLPASERSKVADAFATGRLPARYRDALRDYNRRLAEEGGPAP
jgi:hypothetical protein